MPKITLGNKEFTPPVVNSGIPNDTSTTVPVIPAFEMTTPNNQRKFSKKEIQILIGVFLFLLILGSLPTYMICKNKIDKLESKISILDPLNKIEADLKYKLSQTSKQLDKIEDEDLYKVVMEKKGKKIEQIKEQLELINQFKITQSNELQSFILNKKDELKKKEILYHR
jgi:hypothetical protein